MGEDGLRSSGKEGSFLGENSWNGENSLEWGRILGALLPQAISGYPLSPPRPVLWGLRVGWDYPSLIRPYLWPFVWRVRYIIPGSIPDKLVVPLRLESAHDPQWKRSGVKRRVPGSGPP